MTTINVESLGQDEANPDENKEPVGFFRRQFGSLYTVRSDGEWELTVRGGRAAIAASLVVIAAIVIPNYSNRVNEAHEELQRNARIEQAATEAERSDRLRAIMAQLGLEQYVEQPQALSVETPTEQLGWETPEELLANQD